MGLSYGCTEEHLKRYTCRRTAPIRVDGDLGKGCWIGAEKSPRFVDMVTGEPAFWDTRMAALWDSSGLYVAYWVEEPCVRASFTERDSLIYLENDVEIFIGGEDCYYELELNALGTVFEVFYVWQDAYQRGGRFDRPELDLLRRDVDVLGGYAGRPCRHRHPEARVDCARRRCGARRAAGLR